jgi:two-component system chemotaxis response regulator CheY
METINIICVDDQRTVLSALATDMEVFENYFNIECCESAAEALDLMESLDEKGEFLALIISDHVMPEMTGVDFLIKVNNDLRFKATKKMLLTGLATHQETIVAINSAQIDHFLEKPYEPKVLIDMVKNLTTAFILDKGLDYKPFTPILDQMVLLSKMRSAGD